MMNITFEFCLKLIRQHKYKIEMTKEAANRIENIAALSPD